MLSRVVWWCGCNLWWISNIILRMYRSKKCPTKNVFASSLKMKSKKKFKNNELAINVCNLRSL